MLNFFNSSRKYQVHQLFTHFDYGPINYLHVTNREVNKCSSAVMTNS